VWSKLINDRIRAVNSVWNVDQKDFGVAEGDIWKFHALCIHRMTRCMCVCFVFSRYNPKFAL